MLIFNTTELVLVGYCLIIQFSIVALYKTTHAVDNELLHDMKIVGGKH